MREAYLEHRTVQAVVRLCKVSWITAEKYRVEDNWDRACARVDKLAEDIAVKRVGKRRADNLRIAQAGLVKMAKDLDTKSTIAFDANAVDRLARLVEFLSGDPDSRVDERSTQLPVSPEQIITAIRNLRKPELDKLNASLADGDTQSAD
jgi:hypothetical protein